MRRILFDSIFIGTSLLLLTIVDGTTWATDRDVPVMTVEVPKGKHTVVGQPLWIDRDEIGLLTRDGRITTAPYLTGQDSYKIVSRDFRPYSSAQLQAKLRKEFGRKYHVSATGHFVVVHPDGNFVQWAKPFEDLYHRFRAYFVTRGHQLEKPEFPLVAVVLKSRAEFDRMLARNKKFVGQQSTILGYYSPRSNRIITYDQTSSAELTDDKNAVKSMFGSGTLLHEAAHQAAYNTGIHSRSGGSSTWVVEGLAMLLEAPGINQSRSRRNQASRINEGRLNELKYLYVTGEGVGDIKRMVADNRWFSSNMRVSYPLAWGLTFYLSEQKPKQYHQFLKRDGNRQRTVSVQDCSKAFAESFGNDIDQLEADLKAFILEL